MKTHSHSCLPRAARLLAAALLSLTASAATLTWSGGNGSWADPMKWSPQMVPGSGDTAVIGGSDELTVALAGIHSVDSLVLANSNATLRVVEIGGGVVPALTVANGFENHGTIELASEGGSGNIVTLTVTTGTLTNAVGGVLRATASGGRGVFDCDLDNRGTVEAAAGLNLRGGDIANSGTVLIPEGQTFTAQGSTTWTHQGGAITGTGTLSFQPLSGSRLMLESDFTPGAYVLEAFGLTVNGPGKLFGPPTGELRLHQWTVNTDVMMSGNMRVEGVTAVNGAMSVLSGDLRVEGNLTVSGAMSVLSGKTLRVVETVPGRSATLTVANGFENHGTIELASEGGSGNIVGLTVTSGTLTNAVDGVLRATASGGRGIFEGNLDNRGTVEATASLNLRGDIANSGTVLIPEGQTFTAQGSTTWTHQGGAITGTGTLIIPGQSGSELVLETDFTPGAYVLQAGAFLTVSGPGKLFGPPTGELRVFQWIINTDLVVSGNVRAEGSVAVNGALSVLSGKTLRVVEIGGGVASALTVANGFENHGTIELSSEGGSGNHVTLTVTTGTLTNATGGVIRVLAGSAGSRLLNANLDNRGTLLIMAGTTLDVNGVMLNASSGILGGGGAFNFASATVTNEGTVAPGTSPGILSVSGNLPHGAGSRFEAEIGGFTAGTEHDQLVLANPVTFDGTIGAVLINGFFPKKDDAFTVLTYPARTGTFATLDNPLPERIAWEVRYGTTSAQLVVLNTAPTLAAIGNQTMNEQVQLTVTASATDQDLPAQTLTYSLDTAPAGMTISPSSGQITWTPAETQGPGTHNVTVRVTDNGTPSLGHTTSFSVTVNEVNVAPQLVLPGARTVNEQTELVFIINGTDADVPPNALTYELVSGPPGATFNAATRELRWTPTEAQGPGSFTATFRVTDSNPDAVNEKQLGATGAVSLTVAEVNLRPTLAGIGNQTATEEILFSVTATATDPDLPTNGLAYSLETAPTGMAINPTTGQITWTPTEAQGPGAHNVTVRVTDTGSPALAHTTSFSVTVKEENQSPTLAVIEPQTVNEETPLTVTATATDPDVPANVPTYSLDTAPTGMTINPATGVITWTPTEAQGPGEHSVTVRVTDNGSPALEHTTGFTVTVKEVNRPPVLASLSGATVHPGAPFAASLAATDPDLPANTFTYSLVSGPDGATVTPAGVVNWNAPLEAAGSVVEFTVRATDDGTPPQAGDETFQVTVAGPVEILGSVAAGDAIEITWRALPGLTYRLISAEALPATKWAPLSGEVTATGSAASKTITINPQSAALFLRVELVTE